MYINLRLNPRQGYTRLIFINLRLNLRQGYIKVILTYYIININQNGAGVQMWARDFVGTKSTFSPHSINVIPTFYQQFTHPHKFSIDYQQFSNVFPKNSPLLNNFSIFSPFQYQHSPHSPTFGQRRSSLWGLCWCGKNLGKMLIQFFSIFSFQTFIHCG